MNNVADVIAHRKIISAVHFTLLDNLYLILSTGFIKPRNKVDETLLLNLFNEVDLINTPDTKRFDGRTDCVNLSVSEPNYWLLQKYIDRTKKPLNEWVILYLKPCVLEIKGAVFCTSNAASSVCSKKTGGDGFEALFSDEIVTKRGILKRKTTKHPNCPTDNQAEVLVPGDIPITNIQRIVVANDDVKSTLAASLNFITDITAVPLTFIAMSSDLCVVDFLC